VIFYPFIIERIKNRKKMTPPNNSGQKTLFGHVWAGIKSFGGKIKSRYTSKRHDESESGSESGSDSESESDSGNKTEDNSKKEKNTNKNEISVKIFPVKDKKISDKMLNGTSVADIHITPQFNEQPFSEFAATENQLLAIFEDSIDAAKRLRGKKLNDDSKDTFEEQKKTYLKNNETIFHVEIPKDNKKQSGGTRKRPVTINGKRSKPPNNFIRSVDSHSSGCKKQYTIKNRK
jgi:hypothetical protein